MSLMYEKEILQINNENGKRIFRNYSSIQGQQQRTNKYIKTTQIH
jgi:hypothetical protein